MRIIIVGGVAGGASAAARLRRLDENAEIILLERGNFISYANCGLPYFVGGEIVDEDELTLQTPESFHRRFHVDVRVNSEAVGIDTASKSVTVHHLSTGQQYALNYDKLVLSPGAKPITPPIDGISFEGVFTLRDIPDTMRITTFLSEKKPETAVVVGGGFVGLEMAENLTRRGIQVTIVEAASHVLAQLDYDMACEVHNRLRAQGVLLRLDTRLQRIAPGEDGKLHLSVGDDDIIACDMAVLAVGVKPESELAQKAGLALGLRNCIAVDEHMRTSDPNIYAVGDAVQVAHLVSGKDAYIPLAGPANKQGRIVADHICGLDRIYHGSLGSSVVKVFHSTVASTGLNEEALVQASIPYHKVYLTPSSHASYYPGSTSMFLKALFDSNTGRILGAQLVGEDGVDKRCDVLATAIKGAMTANDLAELELCYAPPYSSAKDPVNMAGFMAQNLMEGHVHQFFWDDVDALPRDGSATLLDVRTPAEYAGGHLDGFINLPVDELREHLTELDLAKPIYINCQSAVRSYIACRILTQKGYTCSHLAGGWRMYASILGGRSCPQATYPCGMEQGTP